MQAEDLSERTLPVADALAFLDQVKIEMPASDYEHFLRIMQMFKNQLSVFFISPEKSSHSSPQELIHRVSLSASLNSSPTTRLSHKDSTRSYLTDIS
jgi:hypothetical protein